MIRRPPRSPLFPYTPLFRAAQAARAVVGTGAADLFRAAPADRLPLVDLEVTDPGTTADVLHRQALADRASITLERAVVLAERRSEEHTSELQSRQYLVCRLL